MTDRWPAQQERAQEQPEVEPDAAAAPDGLASPAAPLESAPPIQAIEGDMEPRWRLRLRLEPLAWASVVLVAVLSRLPVLGVLPLRLSDSSRAYAAWQVAQGRLPGQWDGDLGQTLTAAIFKLAGASDALVRLAPALLGIALVGALWWLRPFAGRGTALLAAFFLALSPVCVAVSRSLSTGSAGALFAVLAAAALFSYIEQPRPAPLAWLAAILGLGFSSDATFLVFVLAAGLFCALEALWLRNEALLAAAAYLRGRGRLGWSLLLIFAAGFLLATTRFGIDPNRLQSAAFRSWSTAFSGNAGSAPWHFPLDVLLAYEPLLFFAGGAEAVMLWLQLRGRVAGLFDRFLLYWLLGAILFALVATQRSMGQIPLLLVPLALAAAAAFVRWLGSATREGLGAAALPAALAAPAFVYVLLVIESSDFQRGLALNQSLAMLLLLAGGIALLVIGAVWARPARPAFLAIWALVAGLAFGLHSLTHLAYRPGDEFLLGPVASAEAPAFAQEINQIAPGLRGPTSIAPALAAPLAWYTRGDRAIRFEPPNIASAGIVQGVDQATPPTFQILVNSSPIAHVWYPVGIDFGGITRWLIYRQTWEQRQQTNARFLIAPS